MLQSALDRHFDRTEARNVSVPPQSMGAQELTFFAKRSEGLRKAVVSFHERRLGQVLHSLFEGLGLEPPPKDILGFTEGSKEFSSLTDLVRHARQVGMHSMRKQEVVMKEASVVDDEMLITRLALQRSRGVNIVHGKGLPSKERLIDLYRRLNRVLGGMRMNVNGLIVELNGGFDVKLNTMGVYPWVSLGGCANDACWRSVLHGIAVGAACEECQRRHSDISVLEAKVAKMVGVRLVMHDIRFFDMKRGDIEVLLDGSKELEKYYDILSGLSSKWTEKSIHIKGVSSIAMMVSQGNDNECDLDRGVMRMSLSSGADRMLRFVEEHGCKVNEEYERRKRGLEYEERLVKNGKRALKIGSLRRGEGLDEGEWLEALRRLQRDARRMRGVLDGMDVVIGTKGRIGENGEIEIPHDYDVSMAI